MSSRLNDPPLAESAWRDLPVTGYDREKRCNTFGGVHFLRETVLFVEITTY
ncbi:MAG: hypothetical protein R6V27_16795 [Balneolaceae bacterium]